MFQNFCKGQQNDIESIIGHDKVGYIMKLSLALVFKHIPQPKHNLVLKQHEAAKLSM